MSFDNEPPEFILESAGGCMFALIDLVDQSMSLHHEELFETKKQYVLS